MDKNKTAQNITIVGMGPGSADYLSTRALEILTSGQMIDLRTSDHPCVDSLEKQGMKWQSFDHVYDAADTFEEVYEKITRDIYDRAKTAPIIYAVPGNPFVAEYTVSMLRTKLGEMPNIIPGTSFIDAIINSLGIDPIDGGLKIADCLSPELIPDKYTPTIYAQVYSRAVASQLKIKLMEQYLDEHPVFLIDSAGMGGDLETISEIPLYQLDWAENKFTHLTSVYVPRQEPGQDTIPEFWKMLQIMRGQQGCKWVQSADLSVFTQGLLDEAQELYEAVQNDDSENIEEELGDVLMTLFYNIMIAEESGEFTFADVINGIYRKMIRRNPHVFGDEVANTVDEAIDCYYRAKKRERLK